MNVTRTVKAIDWAIAGCFTLLALVFLGFAIAVSRKSEPQSYSCCGSDVCARQHHHMQTGGPQ